MRTVDDVMTEAAEALHAEGAKTMPHRGWTPPQRTIRRPRVIVALAAAAVTFALIGFPAVMTGPKENAAEPGQSESPTSSKDDVTIGTPSVPEEVHLLVKTEVPGLDEISLSVPRAAETVEIEGDLLEMTCIYISVPRIPSLNVDGGPEVTGSGVCGEDISADTFGIYPGETCSDVNGLEIATLAVLGLQKDASTSLQMTFSDGSSRVVRTNSGAAIWAWNNTVGLVDLQISGVTAEEIEAAVQLPIGPCP